MISHEELIKKAIPDAQITQKNFPKELLFSIDTRTINEGEIFIAIEGKNNDGHLFIKEALQKKAHGIIIAQKKQELLATIDASLLRNRLVVLVPDTFDALINLAQTWRAQFTYPIIGITGSVGKTSTKELIARLFQNAGWNAIASYNNQNTAYGVALNILRLRAHHQIGIFELGISKRGEMALLASITRPTIAIITNIGHAHMENLGSLSSIALEKREIFKFFKENNIGIINGDQLLLTQVAYPHPIIKFGTKTTNQVQARKTTITTDGIEFVLKWYSKKQLITIQKKHSGAVFNALATVAVGHLLNVPDEIIFNTIQNTVTLKGRFEECTLKNNKGILINDCYNANPESMKAALLAFQKIETPAQKIVVIGDMLELGINSPFWHRQIGRFLRKISTVRTIILVGSMVKWTQKTLPLGVHVDIVPSWQEAVQRVEEKLQQKSLVLVKGSLGMQLQKMVDLLVERSS